MTPPPQTHAELDIVRGLRAGDRSAWENLCDLFGPRIWALIIRLTGGDESVASDLFQETFLAASRSGRTLNRDSTRLWPWLARIAHNQAATHRRKQYRIARNTDTTEVELVGALISPDDQMRRGETAAAVRSVLAELPADYATLLTGKYIEGLSVRELVSQHGGTTESVRSKLARARREFMDRFTRREPSEVEQFSERGQ